DVADAEVGNVLVIRGDREIVGCLLHKDFGENVLIVVGQECATWTGFQTPDSLKSFLDFVNRLAGAPGDFRNATFAKRLHELVDDPILESLLLTGAFDLNHQAL